MFSGSSTRLLVESIKAAADEMNVVPEYFWSPKGDDLAGRIRDVLQADVDCEGEALARLVLRERNRLRSNGFVTASPDLVSVDRTVLTEAKFIVPKWLQLNYEVVDDMIEANIRGRPVTLRASKNSICCFEFINRVSSFTYAEFLQQLPGWEGSVGGSIGASATASAPPSMTAPVAVASPASPGSVRGCIGSSARASAPSVITPIAPDSAVSARAVGGCIAASAPAASPVTGFFDAAPAAF